MPSDAVTDMWFSDHVRPLSDSDAVLWTVVIVASAFDIVTTIVGISHGASEANTIAVAFLETYGTPGIGLLKFSALLLVALLWWRLPDRYASVVLLAFALVSVLVVALNALTLITL
ncbi:DUF5658 family protein [Salinibaculum salinum]|uniref:DUF5658 family protein n=1 Tax=Salinibaculum salinum TaxID=3131996 RepID=UPI0030EE16DA